MQDKKLLEQLLSAESEDEVISILSKDQILQTPARWKYLGGMPNNQSIVQAQQSTPAAALVEKFTNGLDAILLRRCKADGADPRGTSAPPNMVAAIEKFFGDLSDLKQVRSLAEDHLVLYATGSKARPCLSLYDAGEGQLPENFSKTFCSIVYGSDDGSYKGAIPFVQGRFNMGGTGVLPFCGDKYKLQLIVSRVPRNCAASDQHEWAFTLFCFFPSKQNPSWKYLVGTDGEVLTAGREPMGLVPKTGAKSGEVCAPRERLVEAGTLIKMYDFKAPRSNVCGELFKKLQEYLLRPALPLRIIECRDSYKANVMGVTVWDRFGAWRDSSKLETGFEEGASISIQLNTGETVPAAIWVFKTPKGGEIGEDTDLPQTGLRALINGQSHARRDAQFFRTKAVDKEHIAGSMLVTLDCTDLGQDARNALFMSNRETFREDPLLHDLFKKLQKELHDHEGLDLLNRKRYEEKIKNAVDDEEGLSALEELLSTDPTLADLFGSMISGKVAASTATNRSGGQVKGTPEPFEGAEFPTFIRRKDGSTSVEVEVPIGGAGRISFLTDVKNNYFTRTKFRGTCIFSGDFEPTFHLFNGRLTFLCSAGKHPIGTKLSTEVTITDNKGSGPFRLTLNAVVIDEKPEDDSTREKGKPKEPKVNAGPSRPDIKEKDNGPEEPPLTIEKIPSTDRLQLVLNTTSKLLDDAKKMRAPEEKPAVEFVFKYGLALTAMGLLDSVKQTDAWRANESQCRTQIQESVKGVARVIVPLCLSLPKKLPKPK